MIKSSQQLKDLIRNMAKELNSQSHILMRNYMMERFLERLANSSYKDRFILKGGMLIASMVGLDIRATMDIDATIKGVTLSEDAIKVMIEDIVATDLGDGISFAIKDISEIMDEAEYPGIRITLESIYEGIKTPLKIDISTGDIIIPREITYGMKVMFEKREIEVLAYNIETVLAEKMETMIARDVTNTRMRDFYDIHILMKLYGEKVNVEYFKEAIDRTALRRGSQKLFVEAEDIFVDIQESMYMQNLWNAYQKKFSYAKEISWVEVMDAVWRLWEKYKKYSLSLGEAFEKDLFERSEDEYDLAVASEAHEEYVKSGRKSRPIDELWKELDI